MPDELELVETEDQITHEITLEDPLETQVSESDMPGYSSTPDVAFCAPAWAAGVKHACADRRRPLCGCRAKVPRSECVQWWP